MSQRLEQTQDAIQAQQLSTLQVAVAKLVELPIEALAQRVKDEMLENAALEERDPTDERADDDFGKEPDTEGTEKETDSAPDNDDDFGEPDTSDFTDGEPELETETYGNQSDAMGDYLKADDAPDSIRQRADEERERADFQYASTTSFYDELVAQIGEHPVNQRERELLEYLIGSLDEDGLLRKDLGAIADELAIYHDTETTTEELERLLRILQQFEPKGIGARSLQECLHIQLERAEHKDRHTQIALEIVDRCYQHFAARHWTKLKERFHLSDDDYQRVMHILTHLNPRPGTALNDSMAASAPTAVPDFFVRPLADGSLSVTLNSGDIPELRVSPAFRDTARQYGGQRGTLSREQRDTLTYVRQKIDSAQSFINLLSRRRETLLAVMVAIAEKQRDFFLNDDDDDALHPLMLKDVAEMAKVNISTVSRATNSKYVQTMYGTYPLRHFFSTQFTAASGEELSARKVKAALQAAIDAEDKNHPLADEALADVLKRQGFDVARRTVAKYRDMLGIPTARLRKNQMEK